MSKSRKESGRAGITRTEALLHQAADFVPTESAPAGLVARTLAEGERIVCPASKRYGRRLLPAAGLTLGTLLLARVFLPPKGTPLREKGSARIVFSPTFAPVEKAPGGMLTRPAKRRDGFPVRRMEKNTRLARHVLRHPGMRRKAPPKAVWTVETVQTEQIGALYAVWVLPEEEATPSVEHSEPVVLQPAVLRIPLQDQITTYQARSISPFPLPRGCSPVTAPQETGQEPSHSDIDRLNGIEEKTEP